MNIAAVGCIPMFEKLYKENYKMVILDSSNGKESACNVGGSGSFPGLGRSPGEGHGNPLQDSCLANPMDRGAWQASVHRVAKSQTQLSDSLTQTHTHTHTDYRRWYFKSELVELAFTFHQYFS